MSGEDRSKTPMLLERAKSLEEKARWGTNIGFALIGSAALLAKLVEDRLAQLMIVVVGLVAAALALTIAGILDWRAEKIWERLLKDPGIESRAIVVIGVGVLALGVAVLIAVLMGWW